MSHMLPACRPATLNSIIAIADEAWLAYFGLIPDFQGMGLGKWLLSEAIAQAWSKEPKVLKVETCTLDGPQALPLYQRQGFVPYERKEKTMELLD